ncbi:TPA: hypothetical protein LAF97_004985 [Escherichia coli]|nr:hypothetical protein [Escherichia coli]
MALHGRLRRCDIFAAFAHAAIGDFWPAMKGRAPISGVSLFVVFLFS